MPKAVRFIKKFVVFSNVTKLEHGKLITGQEQYHVNFGEYHNVKSFEPVSDTVVMVEFADDDPFNGVARINKSNVEFHGGEKVLHNPCCNHDE